MAKKSEEPKLINIQKNYLKAENVIELENDVRILM